MADSTPDRAETIFFDALELPESDRPAFLDRQCAGDPVLRAEVESLLKYDATPTRDALARAGNGGGLFTFSEPERIGRYRIIGLVGEGGMGRVYEAEQESPRRRVALKVLRPGILSRHALRRFADESELLGRLQHPGIAPVLEAGAFEVGGVTMPYFAMEFIEGETLTAYGRSHHPDLNTRIGLLASIADAIHHAHQRGVVHRDLKPDNILVDGEGRPRILDFGVARAIDVETHTTLRTKTGQIIGTLAYMSPEQLAGHTDVDSRSDVYALGVIAYELLAERRPHDIDDESLPSAIRRLSEERPARLGMIDRRLRGDLETIVNRAMELDPERRYASASEFASDLRRFLAREPILARPPSTLYQLRSFARRNRALTAGVVTTTLALVIGIIGIALALREARAETARAQENQAIAEAVNEFLNDDLLAAVAPGALGIDVQVREVLDTAAKRIEGRFQNQPLVEAAIRGTLGRTYHKLGEFELATPFLERAYEMHRRHDGPDAPRTLAAAHDLAGLYKSCGRYDDAEPLYVAVLEGLRRTLGDEHVDTLAAMNALGTTYDEAGRLEEAEPLYVDALAIARQTLGDEDPRVATLMNNLAVLYGGLGQHENALAMHEETLELTRRMRGPDHPETLYSVANVGMALGHAGRFAEAETMLATAANGRARVLGEDHPLTLWTIVRHAETLYRLDRLDDSERRVREARDLAADSIPDDHWYHLDFANTHVTLLLALDRLDEAEALLVPTCERAPEIVGQDHPLTARLREKMAALDDAKGEPDHAASSRD